MAHRLLLIALLIATATAACGDDAPGRAAGGEHDAAADAAADGPDTATDATATPTGDASTDSEPGPTDAAPDAPLDAGDAAPAAPLAVALTVNALPPEMNGSSGAFTLTLPTEGFTIDLAVTGGQGPIGADGVSIAVDGAPLGRPPEPTDGGFRLRVTGEDGLTPTRGASLCASVTDAEGETATADCLTVDLATRERRYDPFPTVETWLVVLSRDQFTPAPDLDQRPPVLYSAEQPDGVPDLDQALDALGLTSGGANPALDAWTRLHLLAEIRALLDYILLTDSDDPVPIDLVFEGDDGAPDPATWAADGGFSMIALGGDMPRRRQDETFVGRAAIDWNNQVANDNTGLDRGVFATSIARQAIRHPAGSLLVGDTSPLLGGTPFGAHPMDELIIGPGRTDAPGGDLATRQDLYDLLIDLLSLGLASTLAHEIGHSIGLVPPGLPPEGLFAGVEPLPFPGSVIDDAHIDTPGLNVMQTGAVTSYIDAIAARDVMFNPLNLAYLRRQLLVIR